MKVILYVATSKDGFIADKNGGVDWLPQPQDDGSDDAGYKQFLERISIIVMGNNSYQQILGFGDWAWRDKKTYVFTSEHINDTHNNIFSAGQDVKEFMSTLNKQKVDGDVWLLGGAALAKSFAQEKLIDECIITIVPTVLGEGIKLELPYEDFTLIDSRTCCGNFTQEHYMRKN